jgi:hypothetical protein
MQSQQEQLVHELSEHSMGAAFVFEPHEYSKGAARREHADLVWANNSAIILMGMKSGKKPVALRRERSLKQLRGGLRAWRDLGVPIKAAVNGATIELPFETESSITLLTVEDGDDAELIVHSRSLERGTPVVCASIPQAVLSELARRGGSSRDLIELLIATPPASPISRERALELISAQHQRAWFASKLNLVPGYYSDRAYRYLTNVVLGARRHLKPWLPHRSGFRGEAHDFVGALDDAGWPGLFNLLASLWTPDDPGPSLLWVPRHPTAEEYYDALKETALFMKTLPGITFLTVTTVMEAPPPELTAWPRIRLPSITALSLGSHTMLVARVPGLLSGAWQNDWAIAWEAAVANAQPGFPPQGIVSWESGMGLGAIFVGQRGPRDSDTLRVVREVVR